MEWAVETGPLEKSTINIDKQVVAFLNNHVVWIGLSNISGSFWVVICNLQEFPCIFADQLRYDIVSILDSIQIFIKISDTDSVVLYVFENPG